MSKYENELTQQIIEYIISLGGDAVRTNSGTVKVRGAWMHNGKKGWPDITGYMPDGRFLGIEVKDLNKKPSSEQEEKINHIVSCGGVGFWVDDFESFLHIIHKGIRQ